MEGPLNDDAYGNWISHLFPSSDYPTLGLVSLLVALGVFALGYGIARLGTDPYLGKLYPYVGAGATFWVLLWLGWVDSVLIDVWNRVATAFDVDGATYRDVVGGRLAAFYDDSVTLGYSVALLVPYLVLMILLFFLPSVPGSGLAEVVFRPGFQARLGDYSLARLANYTLFAAVLIPALVTSVRGFVQHVLMLRSVAELPFRDVYAAARQLEPLVRFSTAPGTAWFIGVSLVVLWMQAGVSGSVAVALVTALVLIGLLHIAMPLLLLHDALKEAKAELLLEIRAELADIHREIHDEDSSLDRLSLWLDVVDRRRQRAEAVSTWAYHLPSLRRFMVASVIPFVTLVDKVLSLVPSL